MKPRPAGELVEGVVSEWEDWTACSKYPHGASRALIFTIVLIYIIIT